MEGCHWAFRRAPREQWPRLLQMLLTGDAVRAVDAVGWLIDAADPLEQAIQTAWGLASGKHTLPKRALETASLSGVPNDVADLGPADGPDGPAARVASVACG